MFKKMAWPDPIYDHLQSHFSFYYRQHTIQEFFYLFLKSFMLLHCLVLSKFI